MNQIPAIRHRRLHAFFQSKVLNSLSIVLMVCIMLFDYMQSELLPGVCGALTLALFIGYSVWFWVKKPARVVISPWLSACSSGYTVLFFIVMLCEPTNANDWWFITPVAASIYLLFRVLTVSGSDKVFEI